MDSGLQRVGLNFDYCGNRPIWEHPYLDEKQVSWSWTNERKRERLGRFDVRKIR
jgi:hypothetical protein